MGVEDLYLRKVFDAFVEPIFIFELPDKLVFANRRLRQWIGIGDGEVRGRSIQSFWSTVAAHNLSESEVSTEFSSPGGQAFPVKLHLTPLEPGVLAVRVLAGIRGDENLSRFHHQRLETLGMLAGGVAHDFNNILAGILGHTTYLRTILPGVGPHCESLIAIEEGGRKASVMTQQILNFSKAENAERASLVNLGELVTKSCLLLKGAISSQYVLTTEVSEQPVYVLGAEANFAQVLMNLVINARDALTPGGAIRVRVATTRDEELLRSVFGGRDLSARHYAVMQVEDNGHGMAPEIQQRVFEPYFSTKKDKGTGLGLATVQAIVKLLGGAIDLKSEIGKGTSISIYLPAVEGVDRQPGKKRDDPLPRGDECIMVVDDEYPVRNVLSVSLQHLGYHVEVASSGMEALQIYPQVKRKVDLVLLDMLMPHLSGEAVFERLRALDPGVKVLVISGFTSEEAVNHILHNGGKGFIQKPFTIEELAKKVRECLDS